MREPLSPDALRPAGLPAELAFETTLELEDLDAPPGQGRAEEALRLATSLRGEGYNAYVMGPPGAGKHALVLRMLGRAAVEAPTPSDWCYLYDFADPRRPRAVELPAGRATDLRTEMERLVEELKAVIPAAFESSDYRTRMQLLERELEEAREAALEAVRKEAEARGVALLRTPVGFGFAPTKDGAVVDPDEFRRLPEEVQQGFHREIAALQQTLQATLRAMPELERKHRERVKEANREVALFAVGHPLEELRRRWADLPAVLAHLDAVRQDVVDNVHEFLAGPDGDGDAAAAMRKLLSDTPALRRYRVNVIVDHRGRTGAPVVYEDLPTLANLTGRIEHHAHFGTLVTEFTLVRPGALHRANGGFLVLDVRKVLAQPFAWEELKRALRSREIRIEPPERLLGVAATVSLEPEPVPLDVRVVLVGERWIHHLLARLDPEFLRLFKVEADFEDVVPRSPEADLRFARLVATVARKEKLLPLDRAAVARVLEEASRLAGDATRLSADLCAVGDLVAEASHLAASAGRDCTRAADVRAALAAQERRAGRLREALREELRRGTLRVATDGAEIGQVNGLSVILVGRRPFGQPSRITARVRLGKGEVVDIEREVALGGPIHSKGVLILSGYLAGRYAAGGPLTLSASLVFEQSYSGVEGDSASCAEACALLSAIAELPLRQSLAVTGSLDQLGRVQAVGGVTEKVEGFFEVCRDRGLTGAQGAIVPASNVRNLVLREEVRAAVAERRFHLWPVDTVDEAMELLTGLPAGERDGAGRFPEGSVNARVVARLEALAAKARELSRGAREGDDG